MLIFRIQPQNITPMVQNSTFASNFKPNPGEMKKSSLALFEQGNGEITHYMFLRDVSPDINGLTKVIFNCQYKNIADGDSPCYTLARPFNIISLTKDLYYHGNQKVRYVKPQHERLIYELLLKQ